jgi:hypothetical protein
LYAPSSELSISCSKPLLPSDDRFRLFSAYARVAAQESFNAFAIVQGVDQTLHWYTGARKPNASEYAKFFKVLNAGRNLLSPGEQRTMRAYFDSQRVK